MKNLKLYIDRFWISPYAFSNFVALKELEIPFEVIPVALDKGEQHKDQYRKSTFTGKVPALNVGNFWLAESSAITEYLEETSGRTHLLPQHEQHRALARMAMAWIRSDLLALRTERPTHTMFYAKAKEPMSDKCKQDVQKLFEFYDHLLDSKEKNFFFDQWCIVDAEMAFMVHRLILNGHDVPANIRKHAEYNWQRPSVQEFINKHRDSYESY